MHELFRIESISKEYGEVQNSVKALDNVSLTIKRRDIISISGPSGAGKSTLLKLLSGLDRADNGEILFNNQKYSELNNDKLTELRLNEFGFVFQHFNLLPSMNVRDNIYLPSLIKTGQVEKKLFDSIIEQLGIGNRLSHMPEQLSGGEKQRVAIARALITSPSVIFADEPTGNLDSKNSTRVFELLFDLVKEYEQTLIYVTHEPDKAAIAPRKIVIKDGRISEMVSEI